MAIRYSPKNVLRRAAPKKTVEKLVTQKLTLNRAVVSILSRADILGKKKLEQVALRVLKNYKKRFRNEVRSGATKKEALEEAENGKRLMVQRVQNTVVFEVAKDIKDQYRGEFYVWLPSYAKEPDPEHQLNYGKKFQIGKGEMPGDRYGCKCGMNILVPESRLKLE